MGLLFPTLLTAVYFIALAAAPPLLQQAVYSTGKLLQFGAPLVLWFVARRTREGQVEPETELAHDSRNDQAATRRLASGYLIGATFGLLVGLAMVVVFRALIAPTDIAHRLHDVILGKLRGFHVTRTWQYAALSAFYCLAHSGLEEYYWRWFIHRRCREQSGVGAAATIASSLGFMAHHVLLLAVFFGWSSPLTWLCSAGVAVGGAFWAWLYERTGRLAPSWVSHFLVDAGIFWIGYDLLGSSLNV